MIGKLIITAVFLLALNIGYTHANPVVSVALSVNNSSPPLVPNGVGQTLEVFTITATDDVQIPNKLEVVVRITGFVEMTNPKLFIDGISQFGAGQIVSVTYNHALVRFILPTPIVIPGGTIKTFRVNFDGGAMSGDPMIFPSLDSSANIPLLGLHGESVTIVSQFPVVGRARSLHGFVSNAVVPNDQYPTLGEAISGLHPIAVANWVILRVKPGQYNEPLAIPPSGRYMILPEIPGSTVILNGGEFRTVTRATYARVSLRELVIGSAVPHEFYYDSAIFAEFGGSLEIIGCRIRTSGLAISTNYIDYTTIANNQIEGMPLAQETTGALLSHESQLGSGQGARVFDNIFYRLSIGLDMSSSFYNPQRCELDGPECDSNTYRFVKQKFIPPAEF